MEIEKTALAVSRDARDPGLPQYEILALRFGTLQMSAKDNFLMRADIHDGSLQLDFFIWVIRNDERTLVFDMGFGERSSLRRKRALMMHPIEALVSIGVDAAKVTDVVISHLHYDHSGNSEFFKSAKFHIQDDEVKFATGRHMCYCALRSAYDVENVTSLVEHVHNERVIFHHGDEEIAPGISVHRLGGHTGGMQVLRVLTQRGWVVLASDSAHYYRNFLENNPFPIVLNIADVLEGNRKLIGLASSPEHVIPGHDPQVLRIYPSYEDSPNIACLHLAPQRPVEL